MLILSSIGKRLARFLAKPRDELSFRTHKPGQLAATIQKGDVLLVEGTSRFSSAIKYLTQSNWSHSALCIGNSINGNDGEFNLIEADIVEGVRTLPLSAYASMHTRICRPVGLTDIEINQIISHVQLRIGHQYDLKNVFDLARYFIATPPIPGSWKRRMLAFGSGDPTRAICSSLIAEAFQSINYPILPEVENLEVHSPDGERYSEEITDG